METETFNYWKMYVCHLPSTKEGLYKRPNHPCSWPFWINKSLNYEDGRIVLRAYLPYYVDPFDVWPNATILVEESRSKVRFTKVWPKSGWYYTDGIEK
jgi:hypothetical protein